MSLSWARVVSHLRRYPTFMLTSEGSAVAMNRIQFQPGLSMPECLQHYGTEVQCEATPEKARWPNGFRCPRCGGSAHCVVRGGGRKRFQCDACHRQSALIAGTVFQGTKLELSVWFLAIDHQPGKDRIVGSGAQGPPWRELPHRVADTPQAYTGNGRTLCS